ncbi:hypothetical protein ACFQH2_06250 [Natronoarchaeum sp. GCM10025703]|uniref:hypothetical protein n=1 Tax=unclassified Natronoarchaeum TaxID=2620183 RepID=UPI003611C632
MSRSVGATAGVLVSVSVFAWLAGPLLAVYFGTEAVLVTYGVLALAAGALTYMLGRRIDHRLARSAGAETTAESQGTAVTVELDDNAVEQELDQLREE